MKRMVYSRYYHSPIGEFDISPNADLHNADLSWSNLSGANLFDANLRGANLRGANLSGANLINAILRGADLSGVDLHNANLSCAYLSNADLSGADLSCANLFDANLRGANLSGAYLFNANLRNAELRGANLEDAKLSEFQIPQNEKLIVFKKLRDNKIAKLEIPADAKRTASLVGKKCRAERAIVVDIYDRDDSRIKYKTGESLHDPSFIYEVKKEVKPINRYDGDIRQECLPGIHFFMTEEEAKSY